MIWAERDPDYLNGVDARFPGAPNYRFFHSTRPLTSHVAAVDAVGNKVNELRVGITAKGGASNFGDPSEQRSADLRRHAGGYAIDFDATSALTNWHATNGPSWRSAPTYSLDESLTWQKGKHSLSFGGGLLLTRVWENAQQMVPGHQPRVQHHQRSGARDVQHGTQLPEARRAVSSTTRASSTRC